ncbi:hypothetical protein IAQ61_004174 [Plenodomus lingam]|uniref:Similar to dienelactone hydrolase n=1 Tax=Leptosphaeria maculans (strain JN3 / isolate v23.1.3 / race Av1-4-5-6-7-8) TaxID=985895 RepID=E4ZXD9_LEPMJ|nr:similar to dienelactone hydrolase [Plenodomus lingam JN3]KAH9873550.1 hypothetical protein IAQ61_004174 [Plenodomus lingam]CBX95349.1 similar to dienelactone hydrolase [Plenodomus lingam JN3]
MGGAAVTPPSTNKPPSVTVTTIHEDGTISYPAPQVISSNLTLQAPLSRRGRGPGLVLVLDHYAQIQPNEKYLDPPPLKKWAEEGFAIVQLLVPGKVEDGGEFPLQKALDVLKGCEGCEFEKGVGLISYVSRTPYYVEEAASQSPDIKALISYGGRNFITYSPAMTSLPPQLIHAAGAEVPRRQSVSTVPDSAAPAPQGVVKTYRYEDAKRDTNWVLPSDENYHGRSAHIAHSRSLEFLKPLLNGPYFDLEAVWEEHLHYEFDGRSVPKTMATMVDQPYVNHIPTLTGGVGQKKLTAFYTHHFIFSNPPDTVLTMVSRTLGTSRVIDEMIYSFTHTSEVPWLLPGIPPSGLKIELPFTSIVEMRGDRLCHEHISWDQATALKQLGLLPEWVTWPYPVEGVEAGKKVEIKLPVYGTETVRKLIDEGCIESNELMENKWRVVG